MGVNYQREPFTNDLAVEVMPLLELHYHEIASFKDIPLAPDFTAYKQREADGLLRVYTAREDGKLIGYACFFFARNLHYSTSVQAVQDVLYIDPGQRGRGFGPEFLAFCDAALAADGAEVVFHHVKEAHPALGILLSRMGYGATERIWAKRLNAAAKEEENEKVDEEEETEEEDF